MGDYMGTKEASKIWGVSQAKVSEWCRNGLLKTGTKPCEQDKPGSPWRIRRDAIPPTASKNN